MDEPPVSLVEAGQSCGQLGLDQGQSVLLGVYVGLANGLRCPSGPVLPSLDSD